MFIEQPPFFYRFLFPGGIWRMPSKEEKVIYLTFDDGPIPEITPWVLDLLDRYNIKATFFCVGDNVKKHPEEYEEVLRRGHTVGNHTFNHVQGIRTLSKNYIKNTEKAAEYIKSTLFRPPHGHMRLPQFFKLRKDYHIILWDVVTRDYSKRQTPEEVLDNVKHYARNGSVIVFHDSVKAEKNMKYALPLAIEWLKEQGYVFKTIEEGLAEYTPETIEAIATNHHNSENDNRELVRDYR
ncbi:Peptidoglycan/xylan/chitin deacetylase, PgdA/CDA1 family [Dysgonomonas macrotermitis]|uniref:Peptidoglycan/xylan/chitin deacetylase, PgdA/CDA1 family n=1 Tax=Dysgonomonas macrotermitis TaxID=1346286 RepID=A0A1M5EE70_9BACT|nr:Peptidoglycan/xylan/chitin deacetylase, PgdA/CDA1 family [Dysgonomonas macrotermitis]